MTTEVSAAGSAVPSAAEPPSQRRSLPANWRSLWRLIWIQAQNAFNDKVAQFTLLGLAKVWLDRASSDRYAHIVSTLLVIPLLFFAPLAGWLADRYSKRHVVIACSISQVVLLSAIGVSFLLGAFWFATSLFFLLAMQAAIFHPARSGIIKEYAGVQRLAVASGWAQMAAIVAFVAGQWAGGRMFEYGYEDVFERTNAGAAASLPMACMAVFSLISVVLAWQMTETPSHSRRRFTRRLLTDHFLHIADLLRIRRLRLTALGVAFFWFSATLLTLILIQVATEIEPNEASQAERSGLLLAFVGAGVAAGSVLVALASPDRIEPGLIPLGGLGMAAGPALAAFAAPGGTAFCLLMFVGGAASAVFLVPINAMLQDWIEPSERGKMLASAGLLDSLAMMASIVVQLVFMRLGLSVQWQLLILGILCLVATVYVLRIIPQSFLRFTVLGVVRILYRIRRMHPERVPEEGGALLLATHISYVDSLIVSAACDRPVRFVAYEGFFRNRHLGWLLRLFGVVPISRTRAKDAIVSVAAALQEGDLVCLFPEGQLSRTGMRNRVQKGFELMARRAGVPVIPVYADQIWGSVFSFSDGVFFRKRPRRPPAQTTVVFGRPLTGESATAGRVAAAFRELAAEAMAARKEISVPLDEALAVPLSRNPHRLAVAGGDGPRERLPAGMLLAQAVNLARRWRNFPHARIAVVLPRGINAVLAIVAVRFAGRTPVYIEPGRWDAEALRGLFASAGIRTVISHSHIRAAHPEFPWPDHFLYFNAEKEELDDLQLVGDIAIGLLAPRMLVRLRPGSRDGGPGGAGYIRRAADGSPKLTLLPDAAILAQSAMLQDTGLYRRGDRVLSAEPLASAAGFIGMWHALLSGHSLVLAPGDDPDAVARRMREFSPTAAAGGRTFVRSLLAAAAHGEIPPSLRVVTVWTGSPEPECPELAGPLAEATGAVLCPGLVSDDAGAVVAVSQPDPELGSATAEPQPGSLPGSQGRLLSAWMADPEAGGWRLPVAGGGPAVRLPGLVENGGGFLVSALDDRESQGAGG